MDYLISICGFSAKYSLLGVGAKIGWLGISIVCTSGATCLPMDLLLHSASTINIQLYKACFLYLHFFFSKNRFIHM